MIAQHLVIEDFVAIVELVQEHVPVEVGRKVPQLCVRADGLLIERLDAGGEASGETDPSRAPRA